MKILAMDSSGMTATVAVVEDDRVLAEYTIDYKKTHSQTLLPMLKEAGDMIELDLDTVDASAVAGGPGSFTGLRIGSGHHRRYPPESSAACGKRNSAGGMLRSIEMFFQTA